MACINWFPCYYLDSIGFPIIFGLMVLCTVAFLFVFNLYHQRINSAVLQYQGEIEDGFDGYFVPYQNMGFEDFSEDDDDVSLDMEDDDDVSIQMEEEESEMTSFL